MKTFNRLVISLFFLAILYTGYSIEKKINLDHRDGGIIINISNDVMFGTYVKTKMPNDSIMSDFVYQIAIRNLEVGDTIKVK